MKQKPSTPKGTRDFSPEEIVKRNHIFSVLRKSFELFGFQPIETPSFENASTLTGKYGDEGDQLMYRILNSGDYLKNADNELLTKKDSKKIKSQLSDKALRYDLTVPFARYVVQHQNELVFPFKRYQMQLLWRADRPQKGRFREFYQCDADVIGSDGLWQEVELTQLYDHAFSQLGIKGTTIRINSRKILAGIAEVMGINEKLVEFTVALDKLDKIGIAGVTEELISKGISQTAIDKIKPIFELEGSNDSMLEKVASLLKDSEEGLKGIEELKFIVEKIEKASLKVSKLVFDVTLARGLSYYTGPIFEVKAPEGLSIGSIGGGGRYDNLTGIFGLKGMSGVGISFGMERVYHVMEELNLFEDIKLPLPKVLFTNFGEAEATYCLSAIKALRDKGVNCEIYPENSKMNKQLSYANKRNIPFVVMVGTEELNNKTFMLKNMFSGEQQEVEFEKLIGFF